MSDLEEQYNIYADLAQSSYKFRDNNFPYEELRPSQRNSLNANKSVPFNFSEAKDAHGYDIVNTGSQLIKKGGEEFET